MFENPFYYIPIFVIVLCYPFLHNFLKYIGKRIFRSDHFLEKYIKTVNIFFFFLCVYIVSFYMMTSFSVTSGWDLVFSNQIENIWKGRNPLFALMFIIYPPLMLFGSVGYGIWSFSRFLNPKKTIHEDYY